MNKLITVMVAFGSIAAAYAGEPADKLTPAEVRSMRYINYRRSELQKVVDEYNAERRGIEDEIRAAHKMSPGDGINVAQGVVVRAPKVPAKIEAQAKAQSEADAKAKKGEKK